MDLYEVERYEREEWGNLIQFFWFLKLVIFGYNVIEKFIYN